MAGTFLARNQAAGRMWRERPHEHELRHTIPPPLELGLGDE